MSAIVSSDRVEGVLVGRMPLHLKVDFGLRFMTGTGEDQTIEHCPVSNWVEFTAMGETRDSGGQMLDELLGITTFAKPWTFDDVRSLHRIWQEWHLNSMRPECAHLTMQFEPDPRHGYRRLKLDGEGTVCEASGYRMGRAWLIEPLPPEVITEVRRLLALARSAS